MIRKFRITIGMFIHNWLPPHKRQAVRKSFLGVLLTPFTIMMAEYIAWRDDAVTRANVSNESMSLEWYLNERFDTDLRRIYIETNNANGVPFGLRATEASDLQAFGLRATEPSDTIAFPLRGESATIGFKSFGVFIPTDLADDEDEIAGVVTRYKLAGKTFTIIQF